PRDSTRNRRYYVFEYRIPGGNWATISPSITDTAAVTATLDLSGFTANDGPISFRARTYSDSCGMQKPSAYSNVVESIHLKANYQLTSTGDTNYNAGLISWNALPIDSTSIYNVRREFEPF